MAVSFPTNPTVGQSYSYQGQTWVWDGTVWASGNQLADLAAFNNVGRNYLLNAQFNINQRNASPYAGALSGGAWTMDRWLCALGAAGDSATITFAAASDADRAAIGDEAATRYASIAIVGGTGTGNAIQFNQNVEDVRRLGDQTVTLSFWASSPTAGLRLGVAYGQNFGSGGSPSAATYGNIGAPALLTSTWQRFSYTFTLPSTAGKTLGTAGNSSFTALIFFLSAPIGSTGYPPSGNLGAQSGTINLWGVQLELGMVMTPFEHRDPATDLALCQRYYINGVQFCLEGYQAASVIFGYNITLPVQMRATPTANINNTASSSNMTAVTVYGVTANSVQVAGTTTAAAQVVLNVNAQFSADI